jgi:hypothetical protein
MIATIACLSAGSVTCSGWALEVVTFDSGDGPRKVAGRVLVEAEDGGLLLEAPDRRIWVLTPERIGSRERDDRPFQYLSQAELSAALQQELPGFQIHKTAHYLICYNTSRAYARWCGALYERLYRAYFNFWRGAGMPLQEPDVLVALVFRDRDSYANYAAAELGDATKMVVGYYSLATNRITTYDMTGIEKFRRPNVRVNSLQHINAILAQPQAERTVATVIHEATHQLAFNSGLQVRYADNPLWLSEGLAIYFESPDLSSSRGWRGIGAMHPQRLETMRKSLPQRGNDALFRLLTDDQPFRRSASAEDAYAEAWALCYFLMRQHAKPFRAYLNAIGQKPPLGQDNAQQRVQEFQRAFGRSWQEIDAEFLREMSSWR